MSRIKCAFVLGAPRSGSSLLQRLLNEHPDVWAPSETGMGRAIAAMRRFVRHAAVENGAELAADQEQAVNTFVDGTMRARALTMNKTVWVEKTPENLSVAPELVRVFPNALFICLYRRCDDVIYSWLEAHEAGPRGVPVERLRHRLLRDSVERLVSAWCTSTIRCLELERQRRVRTVRVTYEHLVTQPRDALRSVERALGVTAKARVLLGEDPDLGHADVKSQFATSVTDRRGKGARISRWLSECREYQRAVRLMAVLGYDPRVCEAPASPTWAGDYSPDWLERRMRRRAITYEGTWRPLAGMVRVGQMRWLVTLKRGRAQVRPLRRGEAGHVSGAVTMAARVAAQIIEGRCDAGEAILSGKMVCVGDKAVARRLAWLAFGPDGTLHKQTESGRLRSTEAV